MTLSCDAHVMDFAETYDDTCSSIGLAARLGNLKLLKELLEQGKDYCIKDNRGWFPIHEAASNGHTECVKALLKAAYDNEEDPLEVWPSPFDLIDRNALVLAARNGHFETVKILVELYTGNTADSRAALKASVKYPSVLSYLLENFPSDVNCRDEDNFTLLSSAVQESPLKSIEVLLSAGIDKEAKDDYGRSALHIACGTPRDRYYDVIKLLVENGCNVNAFDEDDYGALFMAAQTTNDVNVIKYLVEHGANQWYGGAVTECVLCGTEHYRHAVPITVAAQKGHVDVLKFLIDIDETNFSRDYAISPFAAAVVGLQPRSMEVLLEKGYPINGQPMHGCQQLACANMLCKHECMSSLQMLWESHFLGNSPLFQTRHEEAFQVLMILLKNGVDVGPVSSKITPFNTVRVFNHEDENDNLRFLKAFLKYGIFELAFSNTLVENAFSSNSNTFSNFIAFIMNCVRELQLVYYHAHFTNLKLIISLLPVIRFESENNLDFLPSISNTVPMLMQLCRHAIRTAVVIKDHNLVKIRKLPLPQWLIEYLMFERNEL